MPSPMKLIISYCDSMLTRSLPAFGCHFNLGIEPKKKKRIGKWEKWHDPTGSGLEPYCICFRRAHSLAPIRIPNTHRHRGVDWRDTDIRWNVCTCEMRLMSCACRFLFWISVAKCFGSGTLSSFSVYFLFLSQNRTQYCGQFLPNDIMNFELLLVFSLIAVRYIVFSLGRLLGARIEFRSL